jgi:hypothetical protein
MSLTRNLARAAAGSAAVLAIGAGLASPASAAPHITYRPCDIGAGQVYCIVSYENAVTPVSIRWTVDGVPIPAANDQPILDVACNTPRGRKTNVGVTVSDPTGSAHISKLGDCFGPIQ